MDTYKSLKIFNIDPVLSWHQVKSELEKICKDYSHSDLRVYANKNNGSISYINFATHNAAKRVYKAISNCLELGGLPVSVEPLVKKKQSDESTKLSTKRLVNRCVQKTKLYTDGNISEGQSSDDSEKGAEVKGKVRKILPERKTNSKKKNSDSKGNYTAASGSTFLLSATRTLYVGGLTKRVTKEAIRQAFGKHGTVSDIDLHKKGFPKQYAFVKYVNMDMAIKAMAHHGRIRVDGVIVKIGYARKSMNMCLWVGGIGPQTDEKLLVDKLKKHGTVKQFLWPTGKNYSYVMYSRLAEAEAAMKKLNGVVIDDVGTCLRLDYISKADMITESSLADKTEKSEYGRESLCSRKRLRHDEEFYEFDGNIESRSSDGRIREVEGSDVSEHDVDERVDLADGLSRCRSPSEDSTSRDLGSHRRRKDHDAVCRKQDATAVKVVTSGVPSRTLYIGGLNKDLTEKDLRQTFEKYGKVLNVMLKSSPLNSKLFAFIKYSNMDMAQTVIDNHKDIRIWGTKSIKLGYSSSPPIVTQCLWVGGIGPSTNKRRLLDIFSENGTVGKFFWPPNKNYAYVVYSMFHESERAMRRLNGKTIDEVGTCLRLDYVSQRDVDDESNLIDVEGSNRDADNHERQEVDRNRESFEHDLEVFEVLDEVSDNQESRDPSYEQLRQRSVSPQRDESFGSRGRSRSNASSQNDFRRDMTSSERFERYRSGESEIIESWNRSRSRESDRTRETSLGRHQSSHRETTSRERIDHSGSREPASGIGRHQSASRHLESRSEWPHSKLNASRDGSPHDRRKKEARRECRDRSSSVESRHRLTDSQKYKDLSFLPAHRKGNPENEYRKVSALNSDRRDRRDRYETGDDRRSRSPKSGDSRMQRDGVQGSGRRSKSIRDQSLHSYRRDSRRRSREGSQSTIRRQSDGGESAMGPGCIDTSMDQMISSTTSQYDERCYGAAEPAAIYPHVPDGIISLPQMNQPPPLLIHTPAGMMHVPPAMFGFHPPPPFGFLPPVAFPPGIPVPDPSVSLSVPPMLFMPSVLPTSIDALYPNASAAIPTTSQTVETKIFKDNKTVLSLKKFPVVWSGALLLKSKAFVSNLYLISGSIPIVHSLLTDKSEPECPVLDISQRLNIADSERLRELEAQTSRSSRCSVLLTSPADVKVADDSSGAVQQCSLATLGAYLRNKECAAVIFLPPGESDSAGARGVMHVFPRCGFSTELLRKEAPELCEEFPTDDHLLVLILS